LADVDVIAVVVLATFTATDVEPELALKSALPL
jgi:hypothetical protein